MHPKLTADVVEKIKEDLINGISNRELLKKYGVGRRKIQVIAETLQIKSKLGRKPNKITQTEIDFVVNYRQLFRVGTHRTTQAAISRGIKTTERNVRKIFEEKNLYCFKLKKVEKNHEKRFHAKYAGQLWHTDLHYLNKIDNVQNYLIAFIDDCTRYVVHWEVIDEKTSIASALALAHALEKEKKPKTITIDNGGEFIGKEFQHVLDEKGIECFRTHPYTPEENGKIERFWDTLEKARTSGRLLDAPYIDAIITEYNNVWQHSSLRKQLNKPSTPLEAWRTMVHYDGQDDAEIVYIQ